jgi:hypothetical protein
MGHLFYFWQIKRLLKADLSILLEEKPTADWQLFLFIPI